MLDHAMQQLRRADLIREADAERRVLRAAGTRRAERSSADDGGTARSSRPDRRCFTQAA
ncbi:hypothetical protein ACTMTU_26880 [Streptomyces sp. OZ13]|uniref:hypothetical protein n=1 Tax=Streptomyces sp. OZ13 TaxID=3452210 RepID=UPI003F895169